MKQTITATSSNHTIMMRKVVNMFG